MAEVRGKRCRIKDRTEELPMLRRHSKASGAKNILCGVSKMFSCNGQICAAAVRSGSMEPQNGGRK